ncbi:hypothetical protein ACIGNX_22240 [Actinosynnema sp. NPDC053489]|uniref:hypothetical protein n=1 Tax=Actinosynnema sp. NPDC053489 TaxID=3363916 RepID=UPI0037C6B882
MAHPPGRARAAQELAVRLRADSPHLDVSTRSVPEPIAHGLAAESHSADLVVVGSPSDGDRAAPALAVTAQARCPVVAVPPGAVWEDDLPVVVGTDGGHLADAAVLAAFALAAALGTGVRVVCCTLGAPVTGPRSASVEQATFSVVGRCAEQYPDVPLDVRIARSHVVSGLVRHAALASMLVVGSHSTGDDSIGHRLLHRGPGPVVLIGPLAPTHRRPVPLGCDPAVE